TVSGAETYIVNVTGTTIVNSNLTAGTTYFFKVSAVNASGEGILSAEASAIPTPAIPGQVTGLTATGGLGQVSLAWTATTGASGYYVYRSTTSGAETYVATVTSNNWTDTGLSNNT